MALSERRTALTDRQRAVLALVRKGATNREIGEKLGISEDGVKAHLSRLYLRYDVTNRVQLLAATDGALDKDTLNTTTPLGTLRLLAGRADTRASEIQASRPTDGASVQTAREALKEVDVALRLLRELPPETSGPVLDAVRRRLAVAFAALDELE